MTTYLLYGFARQGGPKYARILVDSDNDVDDDDSPIAKAEKIAGGSICFVSCHNIDVAVPDDCKDIIFSSDKDLYARVPQLMPRRRRRARAK